MRFSSKASFVTVFSLIFFTSSVQAAALIGSKIKTDTLFKVWFFDQSPFFFELVGAENIRLYNGAQDTKRGSCRDSDGNALLFEIKPKKFQLEASLDYVSFVIERWDQGKCDYTFHSGVVDLVLQSQLDGRRVKLRVLIDRYFHAIRARKLYNFYGTDSIRNGRNDSLEIKVDSVEPVINFL